MRRVIASIVVVAAAALFAVSAAIANNGGDNKGHGPVCITSLAGLGKDITHITGLTPSLPGTFELSTGQAKQVVSNEDGYLGQCNGQDDTNAYCVTSTDGLEFETDLGTQQLTAEEGTALLDAGDGYLGNCVGNGNGASGGPAGVFLCYSTFQSTPGVWPVTQAAALIKAGYWQAYAVKGNVPGGPNVGGYHLVCNIATGQAVGGGFSDEGGVTSANGDHGAVNGQLGWYPVVSG